MKRQILLHFVKTLGILLVVVLLVSLLQKSVFRSNQRDELKLSAFRAEDKNTIDVVLIGSSEITADYSSAYAYDLFGFTSFPYSVDAAPVSLWKVMLQDVLAHQSPKLIVIETNGLYYTNEENIYGNSPRHLVLDSMPLSEYKIREIQSIASDNQYVDEKASFYCPIVKYHSKWPELFSSSAKFKQLFSSHNRGKCVLKGVFSKSIIDPPSGPIVDIRTEENEVELYDLAEYYLVDFLDYCQKNHITNIIFTQFPHRLDDNRYYNAYLKSNYARKIIEDHGFEFVNFEPLAKDIGLDPETCFYNSGHMNIYGQEVFTKYLGEYLIKEEGIEASQLSSKQKEEWDEAAAYYSLFREYVKSETNKGTNISYFESEHLMNILEKKRTER